MLPPPPSWSLAIEAVRNTARINDTPTADMNTGEVEAVARLVLEGVPNVTIEAIVGDDLLMNGLGAIHAVGRTSLSPPRLVVLTLTPTDPAAATQPPIALVGKGIVYDTGGLNLKGNGGRGMKDDMSGAGAVIGAFQYLATAAAAGQELGAPLVAALCLAENSIGPDAYRPDDILTMHSGNTVELVRSRARLQGRHRCSDAHRPQLVHGQDPRRRDGIRRPARGPGCGGWAVIRGACGPNGVPPGGTGRSDQLTCRRHDEHWSECRHGERDRWYFVYAQVADVPGI